MKKILFITVALFLVGMVFSQTIEYDFYNVDDGNGNGIRFWCSDNYKIHMGNTSEHWYGPVTNYSIKTNMHSYAGRGWTWGQPGLQPVAALGNTGNMKIAGYFESNNIGVGTSAITGTALSVGGRQDWLLGTDVRARIDDSGDRAIFQVSNNSVTQFQSLIFLAEDYEFIGGDIKTSDAINVADAVNIGTACPTSGAGLELYHFSNSESYINSYNRTGSQYLPLNLGASKFILNNGNVGIGNNAPAYKLDVSGDINFTGNLYNNGQVINIGGESSVWTQVSNNIQYLGGNVGIGTNALTSSVLTIGGRQEWELETDTRARLWGGNNKVFFTVANNTMGTAKSLVFQASDYEFMNGNVKVGSDYSNINLIVQGKQKYLVGVDKNLTIETWDISGIGGITFNAHIDDNSAHIPMNFAASIINLHSSDIRADGKITAKEIEVKTDIWADYVFAEDYNLKSLKEVEKYINENNHLPDVPSEQEVLENGVNLGEMDAILLQKVEELTLYIIDLEKKVNELQESK